MVPVVFARLPINTRLDVIVNVPPVLFVTLLNIFPFALNVPVPVKVTVLVLGSIVTPAAFVQLPPTFSAEDPVALQPLEVLFIATLAAMVRTPVVVVNNAALDNVIFPATVIAEAPAAKVPPVKSRSFPTVIGHGVRVPAPECVKLYRVTDVPAFVITRAAELLNVTVGVPEYAMVPASFDRLPVKTRLDVIVNVPAVFLVILLNVFPSAFKLLFPVNVTVLASGVMVAPAAFVQPPATFTAVFPVAVQPLELLFIATLPPMFSTPVVPVVNNAAFDNVMFPVTDIAELPAANVPPVKNNSPIEVIA